MICLQNSLYYTNLYFLITQVFFNIVYFSGCIPGLTILLVAFLFHLSLKLVLMPSFCPHPPQFCSDCLPSRFLKCPYLSSLLGLWLFFSFFHLFLSIYIGIHVKHLKFCLKIVKVCFINKLLLLLLWVAFKSHIYFMYIPYD